jgi:hypothetical protein
MPPNYVQQRSSIVILTVLGTSVRHRVLRVPAEGDGERGLCISLTLKIFLTVLFSLYILYHLCSRLLVSLLLLCADKRQSVEHIPYLVTRATTDLRSNLVSDLHQQDRQDGLFFEARQ